MNFWDCWCNRNHWLSWSWFRCWKSKMFSLKMIMKFYLKQYWLDFFDWESSILKSSLLNSTNLQLMSHVLISNIDWYWLIYLLQIQYVFSWCCIFFTARLETERHAHLSCIKISWKVRQTIVFQSDFWISDFNYSSR